MHKLTGGCHCGNIHVDMDLTHEPGTYNPRACDCDYCRKHGASYVSDANGSLAIRIADHTNVGKYRQGDRLAEFLLCGSCGVLVCVLYSRDGRLYAAMNANVTDARESFGTEQIVSPKKLSENEKTQRWQELWLSNVNLVDDESYGSEVPPRKRAK
jgi:hypothetical protein